MSVYQVLQSFLGTPSCAVQRHEAAPFRGMAFALPIGLLLWSAIGVAIVAVR